MWQRKGERGHIGQIYKVTYSKFSHSTRRPLAASQLEKTTQDLSIIICVHQPLSTLIDRWGYTHVTPPTFLHIIDSNCSTFMTNSVSLGWLSEQVWVLFINYGVAFLVFLYLLPHCGKRSKIGYPPP
jgi:hypothetical protein